MAQKNGSLLPFTRDAAFINRRAQARREAGENLEALRLFRRAMEAAPDNLEYCVDTAELLNHMGCLTASYELINSLINSGCISRALRSGTASSSALFGQACFERGMAKNTYGTGCFMLMNAGGEFKLSENGLLTTMAWRLNGKPTYALEGSVFMGGATIQWLRDEMKFVEKASQSEALATSITDNEGVYLVPAFTGLGAPHWSMYARGTLFGMTRGTGHAQIVRAGLESIAYQSNDLFQAMARDLGETPAVLRVDGGATANNFLMQFQADISGVAILRPAVLETTALGAALLAGLAVGVYDNLAETAHGWHVESKFVPSMDPAQRQQLLHGWKRAVDAVLYWARED